MRVWSAGLVAGAIVLLAVSMGALNQLSGQIAVIGGHDAPQAATACAERSHVLPRDRAVHLSTISGPRKVAFRWCRVWSEPDGRT